MSLLLLPIARKHVLSNRRNSTIITPLCATFALACGSDGESGVNRGSAAFGDSAGVNVVQTSILRIDAVPDWSAELRPLFIAGGFQAPPEEVLAGVSDIRILPDSAIAVANSQLYAVMIFRLDGTPPRRLGRKGGGPGEYEDIQSLGSCEPGSLAVVDMLQRRMTVLSGRDFEPVRTLRLEDAHPESAPYAAECTVDGRVLILGRGTGWPIDLPLGPHRVPMFLTVQNPGEEGSMALGEVGGMDRYRQETQDGPAYFGGTSLVSEADGYIYVSDPTAAVVQKSTLSGQLRARFETGQRRMPVTDSVISALTDRTLESLRRRGADQARLAANRRFFLEYQYADSFPAISAMIVDDSNRLWIEDYPALSEAPRQWRVFSSEGVLQAKLSLPPGLNLKDIRHGLAAGVGRDSLDAEVVHVFALDR